MKKPAQNKSSRSRDVLGVYADRGVVYVFFREKFDPNAISVEVSSDGERFGKLGGEVIVRNSEGKRVEVKDWRWLSVVKNEERYALISGSGSGKRSHYLASTGSDLNWLVLTAQLENQGLERRVLVDNYFGEKGWMEFKGGNELSVRYSLDLKKWSKSIKVLGNEKDFFGDLQIQIGNVFVENGLLTVLYFVYRQNDKVHHYEMKAVIVEIDNPEKVVRDSITVWQIPPDWSTHKAVPVGVVSLGTGYVSYWQSENEVWVVRHSWLWLEPGQDGLPKVELKRPEKNPLIVPVSQNLWESKATFNPAAITDEDGQVHLLYRAIGDDEVSVLGYARSRDGYTIDYRGDAPVFRTEPIGKKMAEVVVGARNIDYESGGGTWGGCEDPRLVRIGNKVYLTYVAFNGWDSVRIGVSQIDWQDFKSGVWNWTKPVYLSHPRQIHKNWILFPQKIDGKFAVLHSVSPTIKVDYFKDLDEFYEDEKYIESVSGSRMGHKIARGRWDSWIRGAGPPPIKTDYGWLLFYHAMDVRDPNRYKLGAMILDSGEPTKVLYRSNGPVLAPDMHYENQGHKAGVIYACGAVVKGNDLMVYYGGADTVSCVASMGYEEFLEKLIRHRHVELNPIPTQSL